MKPPSAQGSPAAAAPGLDSAAGDLTAALSEFDAVLADFSAPFRERHFHYEEHLERMKRRSSASVSDSSGFSDAEMNFKFLWFNLETPAPGCITSTNITPFDSGSKGADSLYRNSFSFSDEKLNSPTEQASPTLLSPTGTHRKAKLGDTKELEDFIADLDRTLASM